MADLFDGGYAVGGVDGALAVEPVRLDWVQPWTRHGQPIRPDARTTVLTGPPVVSPRPAQQDLRDMKGGLSQITTSQHFPARVAMRSNQFRNTRVRACGVGMSVAASHFHRPVLRSQRAVDSEGLRVALLEVPSRRNAMWVSLRREGA